MQSQIEWFPPLAAASAEGLLAVGGDLREQRLLAAYRRGIFPWYGPGEPILWWSPDPRCVIFPERFAPSRSLRKSIRRHRDGFRLDTAFERVIAECAAPRDDGARSRGHGTWIGAEMMRAYTNLHRIGVAHSAEVWRDGALIGGLYGIALGGAFFGESMFSRAADASKVALALLIEQLLRWDFRIIDCQICSPHLLRLGARPIPRARFIELLDKALPLPGWGSDGSQPRGGKPEVIG